MGINIGHAGHGAVPVVLEQSFAFTARSTSSKQEAAAGLRFGNRSFFMEREW